MKNSDFAERLNLCLDKEGFPPKNRGRIQLLAEMVGLTHRGASKWVNGESTPPVKKFADLAKKLGVNEWWLRTGEGDMALSESNQLSNEITQQMFNVDILDIESVTSLKKKIVHTIQCHLPRNGHYFGVLIETEAMSPRFPNRTIAIFEDVAPKDGDFALVQLDTFPSPLFRQLLIFGGIAYLHAHNPKFERIQLVSGYKMLGRLVQAILSFE